MCACCVQGPSAHPKWRRKGVCACCVQRCCVTGERKREKGIPHTPEIHSHVPSVAISPSSCPFNKSIPDIRRKERQSLYFQVQTFEGKLGPALMVFKIKLCPPETAKDAPGRIGCSTATKTQREGSKSEFWIALSRLKVLFCIHFNARRWVKRKYCSTSRSPRKSTFLPQDHHQPLLMVYGVRW